jgi:hypothetical protein
MKVVQQSIAQLTHPFKATHMVASGDDERRYAANHGKA